MRKQITGKASIQGSQEWHEHRSKYRSASESAIVMGVSPFQKPEDLKLVKAGLKEVFYSDAMRLGNELEPLAREKAEDALSEAFEPQVWVNGKYSASLDGISFDGRTIIEIKVSKSTYEMAKNDEVPEHYRVQVRQQLYCSGADCAFMVAMHPETKDIAITQVGWIGTESDFIKSLDDAWDAFEKMPIPELKEDIDMGGNENFHELAEEYKALKRIDAETKKRMDEIKSEMVKLSSSKNAHGFGVKLYKSAGRKTVAYAKAIKDIMPDADLEKYTSISNPSWSIKVE